MPEWLPKLLTICVLGLFVFSTFYARILRRRSREKWAKPQVEADIFVSGWSRSQLERILRDFASMYELGRDAFDIEAEQNGTRRIVPRVALEGDRLLYLVNYLHYPRKIEPVGAPPPFAVARFATVPGFGPSNRPGDYKAKAYVPTNDEEGDVVFVQLSDGTVYRVGFADLVWRKMRKARASDSVEAVPF